MQRQVETTTVGQHSRRSATRKRLQILEDGGAVFRLEGAWSRERGVSVACALKIENSREIDRVAKIIVAGFQHETNTFSPIPTRLEDFEQDDLWPGLTRGTDLPSRFRGTNIPIAGFLDACRHQTIPVLWASAEPGSYVEDAAFDRIAGEIVDAAADSSVDAVYLDLHGAMATRTYQDGEYELLRRIRSRVGGDMPIAVSLDLHGNMSRDFFDLASVVTVYRTYPHTDLAETGVRAAVLLDRAMSRPMFRSFRQIDFMIPITAQSTNHRPADGIYANLDSFGSASVDVCLGFPPADVQCNGPSVFAYAESQAAADHAADAVASEIRRSESAFSSRLVNAMDAVRTAVRNLPDRTVIADPQDNPGAGATGETTGLLKALIEQRVPDAAFSMFHDPTAASQAHEAGIGSEINVCLGGRYTEYSTPLEACMEVVALADGPFMLTGPVYGGSIANLGQIAHLRPKGTSISVVVGSRRTQNADKAMFRVVGIEPADRKIICVKSSVHFMADYQDIASQILFAESPGANPCRLDRIPFRNLKRGMRLLS